MLRAAELCCAGWSSNPLAHQQHSAPVALGEQLPPGSGGMDPLMTTSLDPHGQNPLCTHRHLYTLQNTLYHAMPCCHAAGEHAPSHVDECSGQSGLWHIGARSLPASPPHLGPPVPLHFSSILLGLFHSSSDFLVPRHCAWVLCFTWLDIAAVHARSILSMSF